MSPNLNISTMENFISDGYIHKIVRKMTFYNGKKKKVGEASWPTYVMCKPRRKGPDLPQKINGGL